MSEWTWADVRERAITAFGGEMPHPQTEQDVIEVFRTRPRLVIDEIARIAEQVGSGRVRSGWAVLRLRVRRHQTVPEVSASDEGERERAVRRAERWLRNGGYHLDRESEVVAALFGDFGDLRAWASDESLRQSLIALWGKLRPHGETLQREEDERAGLYRKWRVSQLALDAEARRRRDARNEQA